MNYQDALELKNAGFPQTGELKCEHGFTTHGHCECQPEDYVYTPGLSELIDVCDHFHSLDRTNIGWISSGCVKGNIEDIKCVSGSTPEKAVKNLWIALNKK